MMWLSACNLVFAQYVLNLSKKFLIIIIFDQAMVTAYEDEELSWIRLKGSKGELQSNPIKRINHVGVWSNVSHP